MVDFCADTSLLRQYDMKINIWITGWIIVFFHASAPAQSSFWNSAQAYLGQKQPGDTPIVFAPGILAEKGYWVGSRVAFSKDGKQFLYGTNTNWFNGTNQKLKYFHFVGKTWKGPTAAFFILWFSYFFGGPVKAHVAGKLDFAIESNPLLRHWMGDSSRISEPQLFSV